LNDVQIARHESESRKGWSKKFTSKLKSSNYKCRDISTTLSSVVNDDGPPGAVEVLLELLLSQNGDVNFIRKSKAIWKKVGKIGQEEKRMDLLATATRLGNISNIRLLVSYADQLSLDKPLNIALQEAPGQRNLAIVETLLACGANASLQYEIFVSTVSAKDQDPVAFLLSAPNPVKTQCVNEALVSAAQSGCLQMVFLFTLSGADGDYANGKALKAAVQTARHDIVTALTLCKIPPSLETLDQAMPMIFSNNTINNAQKKQLMGANGLGSGWCLIHITKLCTSVQPTSSDTTLISMLRLLIMCKVSIEFENAAALKNAVSSSRMDLIDIFLGAENFNSKLATTAFSAISLRQPPS
jgi:hypothetical protein